MTSTTVLRSESRNRSTGFASARFHSPRGALGALALLLAVPITIVYGMLFPVGAEVVVHLMLATGTFLLASSVFDLETPTWLNVMASVAASALGLIFLAQGLAELMDSEALRNLAFSQALGGWVEMATISLVMVWFMAVALTLHRGATMILGIVLSAMVVGLGVLSMVVAPTTGLPQEMRLLFFMPIAWFLFVATRRSATR